ncbi:MAG TPA: PhoH family protein [Epulopiscium sp.]|nr:PhoH family protein [Candidatus Epulonipiscium sp.]
MTQNHQSINIPTNHIANIFGQLDMNMTKIEKAFNIQVVPRGNEVKMIGDEKSVNKAQKVIGELLKIAQKNESITAQNVDYIISLVTNGSEEEYEEVNNDFICLTNIGKPIKSRTLGQKQYVDKIRKNTIVFGIGPAGTGKTYLAMAMAITAFKKNQVQRIILTRPAIEAGEKLGFLPGDLQSKVDPYLRPLYDALYEIMGADAFEKNLERGLIEVAPLAYMRGRTLSNAFIVLDEAQNTTPQQMKMFLTRIGMGSKAVITGDITQIDLLPHEKSGLIEVKDILNDIEGIEFANLTRQDVVRHPLVQRIVDAYEEKEHRN